MCKNFGILFTILSSLAGIVQVVTSILPWFVYDLPFQRMLDIEDMVIHDIEIRQICSYPRSLAAAKSREAIRTPDEKSDTNETKKKFFHFQIWYLSQWLKLVEPKVGWALASILATCGLFSLAFSSPKVILYYKIQQV